MAELTLNSTARLLSGRTIPLLGFGVYQNRDNCTAGCLAALKAGYRHIDSAQIYRNEDQVGLAVAQSGLDRKDIFVTSKVYGRNQGYDKTLSSVAKSLELFKLSYLDLFLIHDPLAGTQKRLDTWRGLIKLRDDGKLLSIGVSNYGVHHLEEIKAAGLEAPSINQIELHPWCQQKPIVEYCRKNGIVIQAYSPLVRGQRLDDATITSIAKKHGKDSAQILIRWSLQTGHVVLPKSEHEARIISNSQVYDFELDAEDMKRINALDMGDKGAVTWNPVNSP